MWATFLSGEVHIAEQTVYYLDLQMQHPTSPINRRQEQFAVALCVLWAMAWGLRAIWLDNRVTSNDGFFPHVFSLFEIWSSPEARPHFYWEWLHAVPTHPPLAPLYSALFSAVSGLSHDVTQISTLALLGLLVVEVYRLARACALDWPTPLLAAVVTASSPILAGWFRVDYHETLLALLVVSSLRQGIVTDLRRPGPAVLLGVLVGLGALTKLSYWVVMLVPAVFFLASRVRDRTTLVNGLVAVASVAGVCGWWYFNHLDGILQNFNASSSAGVQVTSKALMYIVAPQGNLGLTVLALVGAAVMLRTDAVRGWRTKAMLLLAWLPSYAGYVAVFDYWERYIVSVLPISCLLAAVGLGRVVLLLPRRFNRGSVAVVAVALAASFAVHNMLDPGQTQGLLDSHGMVQPDTRDLSALSRALAHIKRKRYPTVTMATAPSAQRWFNGNLDRATALGEFEALDTKKAWTRLGGGQPVFFLRVTGPPAMADTAWIQNNNNEKVALFEAWRRQVVARYWDESPFSVVLYMLLPH